MPLVSTCQLLPHATHIIRIVTEYLSKCVLPDLRIKLYGLIKLMLLSMGVAGLSLYIAEDVVNNASIDLESPGDRDGDARSLSESMQKKRKHEMTVRQTPLNLPSSINQSTTLQVNASQFTTVEKWAMQAQPKLTNPVKVTVVSFRRRSVKLNLCRRSYRCSFYFDYQAWL
ncbi:hypothetical protein QVD17_01612 [Tagetes erecta]|uniref:Uncharacterized protein n=1 Tax=Tagetes erecta TaxID=13708 RepID=A0AAD8P8A5_TARER|nr:hypothetical protein QVD17_01612 [Tagetes erecta]